MFSVGFWQLFEQMANCSASQVSDLFDSPAILGSFGESSVASRRKRGSVAFRRRLSTGLALSLLLLKHSSNGQYCQSVILIRHLLGNQQCPLFSKADVQIMEIHRYRGAAFGQKRPWGALLAVTAFQQLPQNSRQSTISLRCARYSQN